MNNEQAIKTLIQAVQIAQAKGAFTLDDAVVVKQAIDVFIKPQEPIVPESISGTPEVDQNKNKSGTK